MKQITLVCAAGMSTSMLVQKMQKAAQAQNLEVEIRATSESSFKEYADKTDVLLIGPQVGYLQDDFKAKYEPKGIKVSVINIVDYGMMNGEKVLGDALKL
ncbi:PTS sugar transporter subunit IIB [Paenibacillus polymyxa]|jgi:PTS system cellobiose-specific IIB component|uniref:PTS system lactose-specific EIICB component n=1 Tax=Paenibacillus polymyxa TaxID=1406 RepID=A0A378Y5Q0_PAEPO|nr:MULTISPECIES: PTS sugar transporter subunit IIB [Paenibacillus]MEB4780621.1 PTS sugar transporter subunit IIB [Paenibacillus jamilae]KAE8561717.1 PTS sugar transporter subunit IIB [Paenibacillus polymyxa]KAF6561125.1 PTS sugar transporter subunit IIB [Paenibacillus sp. EKM202P]KAF6565539.1 PTS sugar transporter subunit IIB [Paenibacillus sp. EKM207P]KAF6583251.1 PTS sugar transporter subunit IIB [Paenibacillus sp. EKM211P]